MAASNCSGRGPGGIYTWFFQNAKAFTQVSNFSQEVIPAGERVRPKKRCIRETGRSHTVALTLATSTEIAIERMGGSKQIVTGSGQGQRRGNPLATELQ